ncbi:hypothetical protein ES332_D09G272000v1 [Gossypium tomentosum]|uniref:Uncharacterized protein n=1 Tax=Gossypium tomentosum TaxID=34277 RepID=A0A5D2JN84_GOSTO|nr:hypothetical protein ES332_D09G272000v1 [Gossypium tomentosum]
MFSFSSYDIFKQINKEKEFLCRRAYFTMGKVCCMEESDNAGLSLTGFLIVLILAILLMSICSPQPRRPVYAVYRYR